MNSLELPLVIFTIFSQTAIGLVLISTIRQYAAQGPSGNIRAEWITAAVILAAGLGASLFHLGHPLGAVNAVKHLGTAWLSREAVGISAVLVVIVLGIVTVREKISPGLAAAGTLLGVLAIFFTGMTYAPPGYPAVNNALPFVFFLLTAVIMGAALAAYFSPGEKMRLITMILGAGLLVSLVIHLVAPCVWLSGDTVMQATGYAYLTSWLYWARIIIGLVIPLGVLWRFKSVPAWLPVVILAGELIGRAAFFALTIHASTNIGGI